MQLLERTNHSVGLTTAGQVFLVDATRLLNLADQAANTVRRASKRETGRGRVGFTGAAGHEIVPKLLAAVKHALPDIDVVVHELISVAQLEALSASSIDLGIMQPLGARQKLESFLIELEPLIVVLPANHALASCDTIPLPSLNGQPFIMHSPDDGKYFHDRIMALFWPSKGNAGLRPIHRPDPYHHLDGQSGTRHGDRPGVGPAFSFRQCRIPANSR